MSAYAYIKDDKVIIGNDFIERQFSIKDNKLVTAKIINKRIDGEKTLNFKNYSAEFIVAFKVKKTIGYATEFLSSNNLKLDNVNVISPSVISNSSLISNHKYLFVFSKFKSIPLLT